MNCATLVRACSFWLVLLHSFTMYSLNDNSLSIIIPNNFSCLELKILLPSTRANKSELGVFKSKCDLEGFVISMLYGNH